MKNERTTLATGQVVTRYLAPIDHQNQYWPAVDITEAHFPVNDGINMFTSAGQRNIAVYLSEEPSPETLEAWQAEVAAL